MRFFLKKRCLVKQKKHFAFFQNVSKKTHQKKCEKKRMPCALFFHRPTSSCGSGRRLQSPPAVLERTGTVGGSPVEVVSVSSGVAVLFVFFLLKLQWAHFLILIFNIFVVFMICSCCFLFHG